MDARSFVTGGIVMFSLGAPPCLAQANLQQTGSLQQRQALMRQVTQQQQTWLDQRSRCINRAATLQELERCERSFPMMLPGWRHGRGMDNWRCPLW